MPKTYKIVLLIAGLIILAVASIFFWNIRQKTIANDFYLQGLQEFRQGSYINAERSFIQALKYNPRHIGAAEYLVLTAIQRKNNSLVLQRFEQARDLGSVWQPIYLLAANIDLGTGHLSEARQILEDGIDRLTKHGRNTADLEKALKDILKIQEITKAK